MFDVMSDSPNSLCASEILLTNLLDAMAGWQWSEGIEIIVKQPVKAAHLQLSQCFVKGANKKNHSPVT